MCVFVFFYFWCSCMEKEHTQTRISFFGVWEDGPMCAVYKCICIYIYVYMYSSIYIYMYIYLYEYMYIYTNIYDQTPMCAVCVGCLLWSCVRVRVGVCICVCVLL